MKNNLVKLLILTTIGLTAVFPNTYKASALDTDTAVNSLYEQFIINKQNTAEVKLDAGIDPDTVLNKMISIDREDSLYDGLAFENRGTISYRTEKYKNYTNYYITINNAYDVDDADRLTDEIAAMINEKAGANATDREKMYVLCSYIGDNYSYDYDLQDQIDTYNESIAKGEYTPLDFLPFTEVIETGYNKMVCSGFANLTYLTANKLGIDCRLAYGKDHIYNLVRFSDSSSYIICDMVDGRYGLVDTETYKVNADNYNSSLSANRGSVYTKGLKQTTASMKEIYGQIGYYLLNGYGLSPDKDTSRDIFIRYLLDPTVILIVAAVLIIRAIKINRLRRRYRKNRRSGK